NDLEHPAFLGIAGADGPSTGGGPQVLHGFLLLSHASTSFTSRVFTTSSFGRSAFLATQSPYRTSSRPSISCASGFTETRQPSRRRTGPHRQSMSRRAGWELISIATPRAAHSPMILSISRSYPFR